MRKAKTEYQWASTASRRKGDYPPLSDECLDVAVIDRFMIPEVRSVFLVSGRYDVILHIAVRDIDHRRNLGLERMTSQFVVVNIETSIIYDSRSRSRRARYHLVYAGFFIRIELVEEGTGSRARFCMGTNRSRKLSAC